MAGGRSYVSCVSMGFLKGWYYDGIMMVLCYDGIMAVLWRYYGGYYDGFLEGMVLCTLLTHI